jgi:site-specific DNA-methyltransferase (adenine-specific)
MNYLDKIKNNSVHLFLSDIPYGINLDEWDVIHNNTNSALLGSSPAQKGSNAFKKRGKPINGWNKDDRDINKEYRKWVYKWAEMLFPIMKEGAPLFIFGGRRTISDAIVALEDVGFLVKDLLAWKKQNAHHRSQDIFKVLVKRGDEYCLTAEILEKYKTTKGLSKYIDELSDMLDIKFNSSKELLKQLKEIDKTLYNKHRYKILEDALQDKEIKEITEKWKGWKLGNLAPIYEPIAWLFKPYNSTTLTDNVLKNEVGAMNLNVCKINGKSPTNILSFDFSKDEDSSLHEAQKPLALIQYLIKLTTQEGQTVLDAFMGSGTTVIAAEQLNRNYIGIEINEQYYKTAQKRLKDYKEKKFKKPKLNF